MDGVLGIFQSIISSKNESFDIYLEALDEHQSFRNKTGNEDVVQTINYLLLKQSRRALGLQLLSTFLDQCSVETLEQKANQWTILALKACNVRELALNADIVFESLSKLAHATQQSPELTKSFASNHLVKIFASLTEVQQTGELAALRCIAVCLRLYSGASGPARVAIERFLVRFTDTSDEELNYYAAKCYHLLQQVRGGGVHGVNHKTQWKNYQLKLVTSLHAVLDEAFAKCAEMSDAGPARNAADESFGLSLDLSDEPVQRAVQLYIRFRNLVEYLKIALRDPFPVVKPIMSKKILNLIGRGLGVTCLVLQQNAISDNLAIGALLPKMHFHLLQLLDALIRTMHSHLKVHSDLILGFFLDSLKWTSSKQSAGVTKPFSLLRSKTYELIAHWCSTLRNGSRCETIAEVLTEEVLYDTAPYRTGFTLKVMPGARKHMSKKARRQLHKAQNQQSQLSQAHANENGIRKENISDAGNQHLCIAALRCLQQVLLASASLLKPSRIKIIQTTVMQMSAMFYEFPLSCQQLYHHWACRLEIYNTFEVLLIAPHYLCPPPAQLIISILQTARLCDPHQIVRAQCNAILLNAEKLVHPQKEGLLFPNDCREIRNAFVKLKKEYLLNESVMAWANTSGVGVDMEESIVEADSDANSSSSEEHPTSIICTLENSNFDGEGSGETESQEHHVELKEILEKANCVKWEPDREEAILSAPVAKRLKLQNNEEFESKTPISKNVKLKKSATPTEEDLLIADIEATFVDELI